MSGAFWHPFANMAVVAGNELVITSGDGVHVTDADGNRYIDATAALWYCNVGYGRDEIADAAARQMRELPAYSCFGAYANPPAIALSDRIAALAPMPDAKVFLTSGGSDAVDTAAKLARAYWSTLGLSPKRWILSRERAYHGMHAYGTSLAGLEPNMEHVGRPIPETGTVAWDDPDALARRIDDLGVDRVAAFIGEPAIGAGGVLPPPDGYWPAVAEICRERDVLLIVDEVVSAFGRVGHWFACERLGIEPDMILFAKGVTSGYLPLGGVLVGSRVQEPFWSDGGAWFRHGYTYSGHAAACAAAMANLDILERESVLERVRAFEPRFAETLGSLADHPLVDHVRTYGILGAAQLTADALHERPGLVEEAVRAAREEGVLTRSLGGTSLHFSPALVMSEAELGEMVERVRRALDRLAA
jgi:putrescine---pyruvate transaminase